VYVHRKEAALKSIPTPGTIERVPNQPKTQHRSVRIEDADWNDAEAATQRMGTDRAKIINQFIRWYLRRPGAKLPERPEPRRDGA
jgi:recombinational DNA repair protein (RecF pathway)